MSNIRVLCRFRPINSREKQEFIDAGKDPNVTIVKFVDEANIEIMVGHGQGNQKFNFDRIYPPGCSQSDVYNLAAKETIEQILKGYNGTIFAYGQTGAGKSFSMFGDINNPELKGIIPRGAAHIFRHIEETDDPDMEFAVRCSFVEIYNGKVMDLLLRGPGHEDLKIRESPQRGVYIEAAVETPVYDMDGIITVLNIGEGNRSVSSTKMNAVSSRSHSILIIMVEQRRRDGGKKTGKLCLVDLAGSEKVGKTGATGDRLKEAQNINGSLSALGNCINALTDPKQTHVPYRDSKLTRLLSQSLGGNAKTTLVICASSASFNAAETLSTCRFGVRAKSVKNKAKVNRELSKEELIRMLKRAKGEIVRLKSENEQLRSGNPISIPVDPSVPEADSTPNPPSTPSLIAPIPALTPVGLTPSLYGPMTPNMEGLEEELRDSKREATRLRRQRDEAVDSFTATKTKLKLLADKTRQLTRALSELSRRHRVLTDEKESMTLGIERAEFLAAEAEREKQATEHEAALLREELVQSKAKLAGLDMGVMPMSARSVWSDASDPQQPSPTTHDSSDEPSQMTVSSMSMSTVSAFIPGPDSSVRGELRVLRKQIKTSEKKAKSDMRALQSDLQRKITIIAQLRAELTRASRTVTPSKKRASALNRTLSKLSASHHKVVLQGRELRLQLRLAQDRRTAAEQRLRELEQRLGEMSARRSIDQLEHSREVEELRGRVSNREAAIARLSKQVYRSASSLLLTNVRRTLKGGGKTAGAASLAPAAPAAAASAPGLSLQVQQLLGTTMFEDVVSAEEEELELMPLHEDILHAITSSSSITARPRVRRISQRQKNIVSRRNSRLIPMSPTISLAAVNI
eukprot:gnl/Dysnectes_brevis/2965_a3651_892.p1 GENE.gnl/Dysnectes_brevis/2965_a3651_892~~gnl/Dysnectes_brevis/2965_a3651_892.p1  ORF type:complete len:859 (+),score=247.66 gnl/Dysnectes_brevis/2965_a3651_892:59-2635(+)